MRDLASVKVTGHSIRLPFLPLGILLIVMFVFGAIMLTHIYMDTDYLFHIQAAEAITRSVEVDFPHRLYHWFTIGLHSLLPGTNFYVAGIGVGLISYLLLASVVMVSLHRQLRGRRPWLALALTLGLMLTAPILILNLQGSGLYFGYLHPFTYHNPTSTLMRPLALITFLYVAYALVSPVAAWGQIALAAFVSLLLSNAKPNYSLALLPVAGLGMVYRLGRRLFVDLKMMVAILGVITFFLVLQYLTTFNSGGASTGLGIEPFALLQERGFSIPIILIKYALSIAFPSAILVLYWPSARRDALLMLAWACFVVGVFYALAVVELGTRRTDNNFYWSGEITLFLLFFASIHFWLRQMGGRFDLSARRAQIAMVVWGLHIVSGFYWYVVQLLTTPVYNAW